MHVRHMFKFGTPEENIQKSYKDLEGSIPSGNSGNCGGVGGPRPWLVVGGRGATLCIWWERALADRQCICELVGGGVHTWQSNRCISVVGARLGHEGH